MSLSELFKAEIGVVDNYLGKQLSVDNSASVSMARLYESMRYSLNSGGKRFRPVLVLLTAEVLGVDRSRVLPFAAAVEIIHTYSLVHDDLPVMDNDDERRGQPTNHKVFGEAMALLAGDGLLTAAFSHIAESYSDNPGVGLELVRVLSAAAGPAGMVGGQAIDVEALAGRTIGLDELYLIHKLKTGALIGSAVEGAAVASGATSEERHSLTNFGQKLGLAFQLADDILDFDPNQPELSGFPAHMGLEKTKATLSRLTEEAEADLAVFADRADRLKTISQYNLFRTL